MVHPSSPRQQSDSDVLIWNKHAQTDLIESADLTQDDSPDKYQLPFFFFKRNFFEGGPSLTVHRAESPYIEGLEVDVRRRVLAQDAVNVMRMLELAVLYYDAAPHSTETLQKIANEYKDKVTSLEDGHKEVVSARTKELVGVRADLKTNAQALAMKEAVLRDLSLQHALLIQTL